MLPSGKASTLGLAKATPETVTRAKPAVEKSLEGRVAVETVLFLFFFERKRSEGEVRKKASADGDGNGKCDIRRRI